ncbi:MAG: hypothetical protein KF889_25555 [Alphaproteobacteria bacterium]|nr:hypothetical protein [Alphaproteobacteria bacterium]MCW5739638.1 hypothetical protein [Alphaproteobacteria bacterium]
MTEAERIELMDKAARAVGHIGNGHYLLAECLLSDVMAKLAPAGAAQVAAQRAKLFGEKRDAA